MKEKRRADDCHCMTQKWTIWILGIIALVATIGIMLLVGFGRTPDAALYNIPVACLTALGASYIQNRPQTPVAGTTVNAGPQGQVDVKAADEPAQGDTAG